MQGMHPIFEAIEDQDARALALWTNSKTKSTLEISLADHEDKKPLHVAVIIGNPEIVTALLEAGANVNSVDANGVTPTHIAAQLGEIEILSMLLEAGADPDVQTTRSRETPLHMAYSEDVPQIAALLLDAGASLEALDIQRETPLHEAAVYGATTSAELILERGADPTIRDKKGRRPVDVICLCLEYEDDKSMIQCQPDACGPGTVRLFERILAEVSLHTQMLSCILNWHG